MNRIHLLLIALLCVLSACSNNSEQDMYTPLQIVSDLEPQSTVLDWGSMSAEERHEYPRKGFVINSVDDFPNEPNINMTDLKLMNIDFSQYTLLVNYVLIPGYVSGHHFYWFFDNAQDRYEFQSGFKLISTDDDPDAPYELFTYYRSSILVNKFLPDKEVVFTYSY